MGWWRIQEEVAWILMAHGFSSSRGGRGGGLFVLLPMSFCFGSHIFAILLCLKLWEANKEAFEAEKSMRHSPLVEGSS